MAKIVKVTDGDYKVIVRNGATRTITLDTTARPTIPRHNCYKW